MKRIVCEMCNGNEFIKENDLFVCQHCGTKYSLEDAKKMMIEVTVDVTGTVKIDNSDKLKKLYESARHANKIGNIETSLKFYEMILAENPTDWESSFYSTFFQAQNCTLDDITSKSNSITSLIPTIVPKLEKMEDISRKEQLELLVNNVNNLVDKLSNRALKNYQDRYAKDNNKIMSGNSNDMRERTNAISNICYTLGDELEMQLNDTQLIKEYVPKLYKQGNTSMRKIPIMVRNGFDSRKVKEYSEKIQQYDATYNPTTSAGCYIATSIYGSYDCPQVWTLRRYRDYSLSNSFYGRIFIKIYYAISPTIVKWFGKKKWFNKFWKKKLDSMVSKLNTNGFDSTPYEDKY